MPFQRYQVVSPDGVVIQVREYGNPDGQPIVFIHGISQCQLVFSNQLASPALAPYRLITYDLRGHGESSKPEAEHMYAQGKRWADDLRAVLAHCKAQKPLVVGWSLGGRVICQYVQCYGDSALRAICFVGSRTVATESVNTLGPAGRYLKQMCSPQLEENIEATIEFIRSCVAQPLADDALRQMLAYNMVVSPQTRAATLQWPGDFTETLESISVPVHVVHGRLDSVVTLPAAELTAKSIPGARLAVYDHSGHAPFFEEPDRFNQELASFAHEIWK